MLTKKKRFQWLSKDNNSLDLSEMRMLSLVTAQSARLRISLGANRAFVWFLTGMDASMFVQVIADAEGLAAIVACVWFLAGVRALVLGESVGLGEALVAHVACVWLFFGVDPQVPDVVVVQKKGLVAVLADVFVLPGVCLFVQRQSVGMGKGLWAVRTFVRLIWSRRSRHWMIVIDFGLRRIAASSWISVWKRTFFD